jgi:hypothetical protein
MHRRTKSASPPRRRAIALVRPRRFCLARHLPLFPRELSPMNSPHLIAQLDAGGHASLPPCAWPPCGAHGWCARSTLCPSRPGLVAVGLCGRPPCHCTWAGFARVLQAVGRFEAQHCATFFNRFSIDLISRKSCKLSKFIKTCRNIQK